MRSSKLLPQIPPQCKEKRTLWSGRYQEGSRIPGWRVAPGSGCWDVRDEGAGGAAEASPAQSRYFPARRCCPLSSSSSKIGQNLVCSSSEHPRRVTVGLPSPGRVPSPPLPRGSGWVGARLSPLELKASLFEAKWSESHFSMMRGPFSGLVLLPHIFIPSNSLSLSSPVPSLLLFPS